MRKLLTILLAFVLAAGMPVAGLAAGIDFIPTVDGEGEEVSKAIRTESGTRTVTGLSYPDQAREVLRLMNQERRAAGLSALSWESLLESAAVTRALEQEIKQSHIRPDGTDWSTVSIYANGENVAGGDTDASGVMQGWMDSSQHRANILEKDFTSVAVACVETQSMVYWVQLFHSNKDVNSPYRNQTPPAAPATGGSDKVLSDILAALQASPSASATIRDLESLSAAQMSRIASWGAGRTVQLKLATSNASGGVQGQISLNPALFTGITVDLKLGVYTADAEVGAVEDKIARWYVNDAAVVHMSHTGALPATVNMAAKVDLSGLDTTKLHFYVYDPVNNTMSRISNPAYAVDQNGFLHWSTAAAGDIIITDSPLQKR